MWQRASLTSGPYVGRALWVKASKDAPFQVFAADEDKSDKGYRTNVTQKGVQIVVGSGTVDLSEEYQETVPLVAFDKWLAEGSV